MKFAAVAGGSNKAIIGAFIANMGIAIAKFVASAFTGSSAMLSEGIHSVVDSGNSILLLVGKSRAKRPPNKKHPFGHGKEEYFWALIVAVLIFALGGAFSLYEGIHALEGGGHKDGSVLWNYGVLAFAILLEGGSMYIAWTEFRKAHKGIPILKAVRKSKDASAFAILFEDGAALLGLVIALIGVTVSHFTGSHIPDAIASISIGALLCIVAVFLVIESKGLLVGEGLEPENAERIEQMLSDIPEVTRFSSPLTLFFGPREIMLALEVQFEASLSDSEKNQLIVEIEQKIKEVNPYVTRIFVEVHYLTK